MSGMKLKDKVAVITGGNSGIGLATARKFKANGAKLVLFCRDRKRFDEAAASLGSDVLAVQGDVRNLGDFDRPFAQASTKSYLTS
jgi:NAD(P)-dependent dehydrogenase (short-subunit alcohol dehydrogenase family)